MNAGRTARERARIELARQIKDNARAQLGKSGAHSLSLRAIARDMGMVSSALYRYFPSRDDLLTALIIDAYNAVGAVAEDANAGPGPRYRWRAVWLAVRDWATANPAEYALIYGSPVPGYRAPQDTVAPATRVPLVLIGILTDGWAAGTIRADLAEPLTPVLAGQLQRLAAGVATELPTPVLCRAIVAWTQLFGMLSFELFGQFVGSVDPSEEFVAYAVDRMADFVGLCDV